jgi:hypothetical protein
MSLTTQQANMTLTGEQRRRLLIFQRLVMLRSQQLDEEVVLVDLIRRRQERREARPRRIWCRQWLGVDRRFAFGQFSQLMPELRREDPASYLNFVRMTPQLFDELVDRLQD